MLDALDPGIERGSNSDMISRIFSVAICAVEQIVVVFAFEDVKGTVGFGMIDTVCKPPLAFGHRRFSTYGNFIYKVPSL